jgi:hypothetical protein
MFRGADRIKRSTSLRVEVQYPAKVCPACICVFDARFQPDVCGLDRCPRRAIEVHSPKELRAIADAAGARYAEKVGWPKPPPLWDFSDFDDVGRRTDVAKPKAPPAARHYRCRKAKLTESQVAEIRRLYSAGDATQVELAKRYGVSRGAIQGITSGTTWRKAA